MWDVKRVFFLLAFVVFSDAHSQCVEESIITSLIANENQEFFPSSIEGFQNTISISGSVELTSELDYFLIELADDLSPVSALSISSEFSDTGGPLVHTQLSNGNYVIAGYSTIGGQRHAKLVCFDQIGIAWQKRIEGTYESPRTLYPLDNGGLLVGGTSESFSNGSADAFIMEMDSNGNVLWKKGIGASNNEHFYAVSLDLEGNVLAVGNNQTFSGTHRPTLATFDEFGELLSYNLYTGQGLALFTNVVKSADGYFLAGYVQQGVQRGLIVSVDSDFEVVWSKRVQIDGSGTVGVGELSIDSNGQLIASVINDGPSNERLHFLNIDPTTGDLNYVGTAGDEVDVNTASIIGGYQTSRVGGGAIVLGDYANSPDILLLSLNECFNNNECLVNPSVSWQNYNTARIDFEPGERILQDVFDIEEFSIESIDLPAIESCGIVCQGELILPDNSSCTNQAVIYSFDLQNEAGAIVSYSWEFGNGTTSEDDQPVLTYDNPGDFDFQLTVVTESGCTYQSTGTTTIINSPPPPDVETDIELCEGDVFILDASDYPDWDITDEFGNSTDEYVITETGTYGFDFQSDCGQEIIEISVTFVDSPTPPDVETEIELCLGESFILSASDYPTWNITDEFGNSSEEFEIFESGLYSFNFESDCGQENIVISVTIIDSPTLPVIETEVQLCQGETFILLVADFPEWTITDEFGNSSNEFELSEPGTYEFSFESICDLETVEITVSVVDFQPEPFPQISNICEGQDTVTIGFFDENYFFDWEDGTTNPTIDVFETGIYEVVVTDFSGQCSLSYSFQVLSNPPDSPPIFDFSEIEFCLETENTLSFPNEFGPYSLSNGEVIENTFEITESATIIFSFSDDCYTYSDSITVNLESCLCPAWVPNVFTPDEDGLNDFFKPVIDCPVFEYRLTIFNRWGREIFVSQDYDIPWRGESPNSEFYANDGIYVYLITFNQNLNGLAYPVELTGMVTLLR